MPADGEVWNCRTIRKVQGVHCLMAGCISFGVRKNGNRKPNVCMNAEAWEWSGEISGRRRQNKGVSLRRPSVELKGVEARARVKRMWVGKISGGTSNSDYLVEKCITTRLM